MRRIVNAAADGIRNVVQMNGVVCHVESEGYLLIETKAGRRGDVIYDQFFGAFVLWRKQMLHTCLSNREPTTEYVVCISTTTVKDLVKLRKQILAVDEEFMTTFEHMDWCVARTNGCEILRSILIMSIVECMVSIIT